MDNDRIEKLLNRLEADFSAYIRGIDTLTGKVDALTSKVETIIAHSPLTNNKIRDVITDATAGVVEVLRDDIKEISEKVGES